MLLQILQLLIVSYIASHGEGRQTETRRISKYYSIIHQHHLRKEKDFTGSVKNIGNDEAISGINRNNTEKNRVPKSKPQAKDKHGNKNAQGLNVSSMVGFGGTSANQFSERKEDVSEKNYAHASWNHFIYKMNAASETLNYPVKTQEVQREICKTLPFTQNITHENCDTVIIQNNLCFGKCNSLYVPNQRHQFNICSYCLPFKFTMNNLKLNCTGSRNVVKVIMMVEECKCVVHSQNSHGVNNIKDSSLHGHH
ncbi:cerberus [Hyla sarda]|uniref:cerberus n=1 Tax=Hyla sarda TaxID=327740 RepID=UPI0024C21DBB|nr:cerberus [Hyla sarda]